MVETSGISKNKGSVSKPKDETRFSKSCDYCKFKKIKCSQRKPICENCEKTDQECVYSVMKRPGLKVGYGQQFLSRLDAFETVVENYQNDTALLKDQFNVLESKIQQMDQQLMQSPTVRLGENSILISNDSQQLYNQQFLAQMDKINQALDSNETRHIAETDMLKSQLRLLEERLQIFENRAPQFNQTPTDSQEFRAPKRASLSYVINDAERDNVPGNLLSNKRSQISDISPLDDHINDFNANNDRNEHISDTHSGQNPNSSFYENNNDNTGVPTVTYGIPPVDKIIVLVDLFFKKVNPIFPIVHRDSEGPKILKKIDSSNMLLLGVLINALNFGSEMLSRQDIEGYFASLKQMILGSCFSMKNTTELKAMTLLAIALYSKANNHETWTTISMVVGGCLHLALIKDPLVIKDPSLLKSDAENEEEEEEEDDDIDASEWNNWVSKESLRHLVWEIYKLDKLSSMGSHFSPKLPSSELTCFLPLKTEYWELQHLFNKEMIEKGQTRTLDDSRATNKFTNDKLYGTNCYIIEALNLMGECLKFRRSPVEVKDRKDILAWQLGYFEIESKIKDWIDTLPQELEEFLNKGSLSLLENGKPTVENIILHGLYHTMVIRLHSLTAFSQVRNEGSSIMSAQASKTYCLTSARAILKLSESLPFFFNIDGETVYEMFGPYYAFAIWVSGRVLLVDSIHTQGTVDSDFEYAISLLRKMGRKWECASKYADILDFFKDDTMSMDTISPDGNSIPGIRSGLSAGVGPSYNDDARIIADIKLTSSSLDSLLSKKIARYKSTKGSTEDLWVFDWFKLPLNDNFYRDSFQ